MEKSHTTKHRDGNGRWHETRTTHYDNGASKSVTKNTTDRTLLYDGKLESITRRDKDGNSYTKKF